MGSRIAEALLFWLMFLAGGACLASCLLLPPWFEYQATHAQWQAAEQRAAEMRRQATTVSRQIDRLKQDEAYLNRIAFEELGLPTPGVETLAVIPSTPEATETAVPQRHEERLALLNQMVQRYPLAWVFVRSDTRGIAMAASGLMLVAALLLRRPVRPQPAGPGPGGLGEP